MNQPGRPEVTLIIDGNTPRDVKILDSAGNNIPVSRINIDIAPDLFEVTLTLNFLETKARAQVIAALDLSEDALRELAKHHGYGLLPTGDVDLTEELK